MDRRNGTVANASRGGSNRTTTLVVPALNIVNIWPSGNISFFIQYSPEQKIPRTENQTENIENRTENTEIEFFGTLFGS